MKRLPKEIQALLITQLFFNIGPYLVVPFIAVELSNNLGASGVVVGLVLGTQTSSQRGMSLLGGGLVDRFGMIKVLLVGVAPRIVGFLVTRLATSVPMMFVGIVLIDFAVVLFSFVVESLLAGGGTKLGKRRVRTCVRLLALDKSYPCLGLLTGPVVGTLLIPIGFSAAFFAGAAIFTGILVMHLLLVRRWGGVRLAGGDMTAAWERALHNRAFIVLAMFYSIYLLAYGQQYLALPVELRRATGNDEYLNWFFIISAVFVIGLRTTVTKQAEELPIGVVIGGGFGLMAFISATTAVYAPIRMKGWWALAPAVTMLLVTHLGMIIVASITRDLIGELTGNEDPGSAYGFLDSFGGLTVLMGSIVTGVALDWAETPQLLVVAPWAVTIVLLLVSTVGLIKLRRQRQTTALADTKVLESID